MDLTSFDKLKTTTGHLTVCDPKGQPLHAEGSTEDAPKYVVIELVSQDSPAYDRVHKRMVTEQTSAVTASAGRGGAPVLTGEQAEKNKISLLVACTVDWIGFKDNGQDFPYSPENARDLYERLPFIREQVDRFVHDRGNFLPG